jgi:hypothetical protein
VIKILIFLDLGKTASFLDGHYLRYKLVRFAHNWNGGPPSPSRDLGGIGRRDKNVTGLHHCIISVTETLVFKSGKSDLGQGIMGDLVLLHFVQDKFTV